MWRMNWGEGREESEVPLADHGAVQAAMINSTQECLVITGTLRSKHTSSYRLHLTHEKVVVCGVLQQQIITEMAVSILPLMETGNPAPAPAPPKNRSLLALDWCQVGTFLLLGLLKVKVKVNAEK